MADLMITGAAGQVATMLRPYLHDRFGRLVLSDVEEPADLHAGESFRPADLGDSAALEQAMSGVDRIIHLGGRVLDPDWNGIAPSNITGTYNLFDTARAVGVKRVVYASSVHAVGFYGRHRRIGVDHRVRPDGFYGLSKAFGEAIGALYADKHGLRVMSIRIGNVNPEPIDTRRLSIWIHPEDLFQLCEIALTHPDIHNQVVFGASDNARSWWDNAPAYALGYRPRHRAEDHEEKARAADGPADPVGDRFQGGSFASDGFDGDAERSYWS